MSAASAQSCVVCHGSSSKYKCPSCRSATCSLACSKEHASIQHPPATTTPTLDGKVASTSTIASETLLPSLQVRNEEIKAPKDSRFNKVGKYVSMSEYDSEQLLEDFEYLQYVSKCVTMLGKDIVKKGWMRDMEQQQQQQQQQNQSKQHQHGGRASGTNAGAKTIPPKFYQHVPVDVKNRQMFENWLRKLKLPIMLVPDGMSWRKENQTRWKNNTKQLLCTLEVKVCSSTSTNSSTRSLVHHVSWEKSIAEVILKELEKRGKQRNKGDDDSLGTTDSLPNVSDPVSLARWRQSLCFAVSISNERLRNESSSKFLEWWQRQVKNGMVKADGLELDEEKRNALEQLRRGAWGAIEGMDESERLEQPDSTTLPTASKPEVLENQSSLLGGLISSSLLDKMQAARAIREQQLSQARTEAEKQGKGTSSEVISSKLPKRSLVLLDGSETFQSFLQSLPKGYAIVEYFHIEVWDKKDLHMQIKKGNVIKESLSGQEEKLDEESGEEEGKGKRERIEEGGSTISPAAKRAKSSSNALGGLAAYASSEEDEEDEQDEEQEEEEEEEEEDAGDSQSIAVGGGGGSLAEIARTLGLVASKS